jgi:hypothetical protein
VFSQPPPPAAQILIKAEDGGRLPVTGDDRRYAAADAAPARPMQRALSMQQARPFVISPQDQRDAVAAAVASYKARHAATAAHNDIHDVLEEQSRQEVGVSMASLAQCAYLRSVEVLPTDDGQPDGDCDRTVCLHRELLDAQPFDALQTHLRPFWTYGPGPDATAALRALCRRRYTLRRC